MDIEGVEPGTCTRCRARTMVKLVKVERAAIAIDRDAVVTTLCERCIVRATALRITPLTPERLTQTYV